MNPEQNISLSELCAHIQDAIENECMDTYWVRAEISSLSLKGGHCYMDLVEKSSSALLSAKVRATCWSNVYAYLSEYFRSETGSPLQVGMQILIEVEVQFHAVYGMSLNIVNIDPTFTSGNLAIERQKTITRLQEEGIIDMQKSLSLSSVCRRLAVVSSQDAAGYQDFVDQLQHSGFAFQTALFPAAMQGENAVRSIVAALQTIAAQEEDWDAVVIIRGGGASADLTCFDAYELCAHCAQFPLPIMTGIGHTRDVSVLDMVAYMALKTPTAVAAFFAEQRMMQLTRLQELRRRLKQTGERQILVRRHRLEILSEKIRLLSPERIYRQGYSLVTKNGQVIRLSTDLKKGDIIETHLSDGTIQSQVL